MNHLQGDLPNLGHYQEKQYKLIETRLMTR